MLVASAAVACRPVFVREEDRKESKWDLPQPASARIATVYPGAVAEPI